MYVASQAPSFLTCNLSYRPHTARSSDAPCRPLYWERYLPERAVISVPVAVSLRPR